MKRSMYPIFLALLLFLAVPALAANVDPSGNWNFATSNSWGPHNKDTSGTCVIEQDGKTFTFTFKTGYRCDPEPVCSLEGMAAGKAYTFSTKDQVDDEGGMVRELYFNILASFGFHHKMGR